MATIGERDTLITIQTFATGKDAAGQPTQVWEEFAKAWAKRCFNNGSEKVANEQIEAITKIDFVIDKIPGIKQTMRVLLDDEAYNITAINDTLPDEIILYTESTDRKDE
ncbi:phage head closure protein [Marinifilum flexuosum]|uniref:SPP1 family predicted phage head-tail adaptor n=1 Tax=Marinifilum flexuosum TaxID=1117708 RepID=A0A419WMU6_9BACT|nr:phage head closure protein [Marinifilum flexuosum]RKD96781.1 SPP1 family predicted phage head-tail adaptor [Marinifilum flexuosum]